MSDRTLCEDLYKLLSDNESAKISELVRFCAKKKIIQKFKFL